MSLLFGRIGSLPLFCLTGGVGWLLSLAFSPRSTLPDEPISDHFLVADGQHISAIQPSVWPVLPASSPYPDASEGTSLQGTDLLGCWP